MQWELCERPDHRVILSRQPTNFEEKKQSVDEKATKHAEDLHWSYALEVNGVTIASNRRLCGEPYYIQERDLLVMSEEVVKEKVKSKHSGRHNDFRHTLTLINTKTLMEITGRYNSKGPIHIEDVTRDAISYEKQGSYQGRAFELLFDRLGGWRPLVKS